MGMTTHSNKVLARLTSRLADDGEAFAGSAKPEPIKDSIPTHTPVKDGK